MAQLVSAAILLALCAGRAFAAPQGGVRITDNLYGTTFVTAQEGWAVGAFGTIFRTRDGGVSWYPQVSHTTESLFGVHFADGQNGWIVGRTGLILHTADSGETWKPQTSGVDRHLFQVRALDAQHVWAIGDWGTILATADGGQTWRNRSLDRDVVLNGESWADANHGWIVGEGGAVIATSDGGATWHDQNSGVQKTLFGVCFTTVREGWAVGIDGLVLRTRDGGETWTVQHGTAELGALEQVGFAEAIDNPTLYDVAIAGPNGYAVGEVGAVLATTDGGATWERRQLPGEWRLRWIRAVALVPGTHGGFVGASGLTIPVAGSEIKVP